MSITGDTLRYIPHVGSSSHVKYKAFRCSFDYSKPQVLKDDSQILNRAKFNPVKMMQFFCLCQGPLAVVASLERSLSLSSKVVQKK